MALVTEFTCNHCGRKRFELVTVNRVCGDCREAIARADREAYMAKLVAIPLEERVRRIELELYELDVEKRLAKLEYMHIRY